MNKIRLTKQFNFEMAHALWNYDGSCRNVHGHSYQLFVTVIGEPIHQLNSSKNGMVVDFSDFKKWLKSQILDDFDHCFVISSDVDISSLKQINQMFEKLKVVDFQPTCENLLLYMADIIKAQLPKNIKLFSLKLRETPTSFAEWFADDQN
jgi:6-pyruvoyltetrahydropterin/6-carboxytetrahydropterin synthase